MKCARVYVNILFIVCALITVRSTYAQIIITEILPNPSATNDEGEFVELKNIGNSPVDLASFQIDDDIGLGQNPKTLSGILNPGAYIVFYFNKVFNNTSDSANLLDGSGQLINSVSYQDPPDDTSFALINDLWTWTTNLTPGVQNQTPTPQQNSNTSTTSQQQTTPSQQNYTQNEEPDQRNGVVINEILPNPTGDDKTLEFIELFNTNGYSIVLSGWQLDDATGGSHPYTIPDGSTIAPHGFLVFYSDDTNIAFNNTGGDIARLLRPDGSIADSIPYSDNPNENTTYAKTNHGSWGWTKTPTPGSMNIFETKEPTPKEFNETPKKITSPAIDTKLANQTSNEKKEAFKIEDGIVAKNQEPNLIETETEKSQNTASVITPAQNKETTSPLIDFKSALIISITAGVLSIILRRALIKKSS